ncbi:MAG: hypothetical protein ACERLG_11375 [Sedimentibacter sp.]
MLIISKNLNAIMLVYFSDNPVGILNDCILRNNIKHIVLESSGVKAMNFQEQLYVKSGEIEIHNCKCK